MLMKAFISATKGDYTFRVRTSSSEKKDLSQKEAISLFQMLYEMSNGVDVISTLNSHHSADVERITITSTFFHEDDSPTVVNTVSIDVCMFMSVE